MKFVTQATYSWILFSMLEIQEILKAYSNVFSLGLDHITWQYLKLILANNTCVIDIFFFANICISL